MKKKNSLSKRYGISAKLNLWGKTSGGGKHWDTQNALSPVSLFFSWQSFQGSQEIMEREKTVSSLRLQVDLHQWFLQEAFFVAIIVGIVYAKVFRWKETLTGKLFVALMVSITATLLRSVLLVWHVITLKETGPWIQFLIWLNIIALGAFGVIVALLLWEGLRQGFSESENRWVCRTLHLGKKFPSRERSGKR